MSSPPRSPSMSVEELPAWLVQRTRHAGLFGARSVKLLLVALICITLGFIMTTSFGPSEDVRNSDSWSPPYGDDTADILEGPLFGGSGEESKAGPVHASLGDELDGEDSYRDRKPSISDALSDLHHAVTDKVGAWKSWKDNPSSKTDGKMQDKIKESPGKNKDGSNSSYIEETIMTPDRESLGERTRVGKATIIFDGASIYERAVRTHEAHDRMHGYPLHVLRQRLMDDVWSKPAYILSLLLRELARPESERLQWLLWVDADTILLNPYIAIETFLPPGPEFDDVHLLVSHDWNGLNNGVFPVRVNQWAVDLFSAIVSYRYYRPDASLVFRDQSAMDALLQEKRFAAHTVEAPQRWFNAYQGEHNETLAPYQVRRGDFLVHFAGVIDRHERMTYWLERAEEHQPDWEMEVQHTSYPAEVRDFWRQLRGGRADSQQAMVDELKKAHDLLLLTDQRMNEYQDRLMSDEINAVIDAQTKLRQTLEQDPNIATIEESITKVEEASAPLNVAKQNAHKILLKEAHESIFAAEKDLLEHSAENSPALDTVTEKAANLKHLVLQPDWQKSELNFAIEELRQARSQVSSSLDPSSPAVQKQKELETQLEEQRKVIAEAEKAKAELLGLAVVTPVDAAPVIVAVTSTEIGDFAVTHTRIEAGDFAVTHTATQESTVWHVVVETVVPDNPNR